jgi:AhpC/TSA family protein
MSFHDSIEARNGAAVLDAPRASDKQNVNTSRAFYTCAKVGHPAPAFTMKTTREMQRLESRVSLDDYRGAWLVLFFYPRSLRHG